MIWNLHGVIIEGLTNDATLRASWSRSFGSLSESALPPNLICRLDVVDDIPQPPSRPPHFSQKGLLDYYVAGEKVVVHFPRYGQLDLDLEHGVSKGRVLPAVMTRYGLLEDLVAISLSPHLRRRNQFLIHAFSAAHQGRGVLLVGGIGAGKTTTGIALLDAGWQLLSNDSPRWLASEQEHAGNDRDSAERRKVTTRAESIWPDVWLESAPIGAILFPEIEARQDHAAELLPPRAALTRLIPHAMEQWDKMMMSTHLTLLRRMVEIAPAYRLRLGSEVSAIPDLLRALIG
jgi:hypothetical protein